MTIYKEISNILSDGQPRSIQEILPHLPELAQQKEGEEVLRLLLRLNPRLRLLPDRRWIQVASELDPEQRIVNAAQNYFQTQQIQGELIGRLSKVVAVETGYEQSYIRSILLEKFENNAGRMIYNRQKEH